MPSALHPVRNHPAPRRAAGSEPPRTGRCRRCGARVVACRNAAGQLVPVHPEAVVGGELLINGERGQIVHVLSEREAATARRNNQLGFTLHQRVCRGPNRPPRDRPA
jgi:hypothetical protein